MAERDAAEFHRADANVPTTIFIHGNRIGPDRAVEYGWRIYGQMQAAACGRQFRLVIWLWPAEQSTKQPPRRTGQSGKKRLGKLLSGRAVG